jgi:hypothetical protein
MPIVLQELFPLYLADEFSEGETTP